MVKKKRKYNPNLIKTKHCYTITEICEIYHKHHRTVQTWRKQGLKSIDEASKPYLFIGEEVRRFLKGKRQKTKHPLQAGEFFCPKCKNPRKSLPDKVSVIITDKRLGKDTRQAFIKGICEICNTPLLVFSSERKIKELRNAGILLTELGANVYGSEDSSYNTDLKRGEKCVK